MEIPIYSGRLEKGTVTVLGKTIMNRFKAESLRLILGLFVKGAAALYRGEGVNVVFMIMPTGLVSHVLRNYGATVGSRVRFNAPLTVHNSNPDPGLFYSNLYVGSDCFFGRELLLDLKDRVEVGDRVTISHRVTIITHTDAGESPLGKLCLPRTQAPVKVRNGAYIGANVIILQGVEIGSGTIIGAGAVVTKNIPPHSVAVGVPARVIRESSLCAAHFGSGEQLVGMYEDPMGSK